MKRVLLTVALAAACIAAGTTAFASHHATKTLRATSAHVAANGICDPSHCPLGSCPLGSKAKMSAAAASQSGAACASSASCQGSCRRQSASAVAANVAKR